jgi:murein DD-endopeptidase MepM/ murein hydrolase activator NlpD
MLLWFAITTVHSLPLRDCSDQRPCYITAYKDAQAASGQVLDWYCRDHSYDDHDGTDFGIGGFEEMDRERPVFATASGRVEALGDGAEDRCTTGRCSGGGGLGNYVFIRHEDGSQSRFAHLKRGSISVAVGDEVTCATRLGAVGSSGYSTGPHLHFELRVNERPVDPYEGDCSSEQGRWRRQAGYRELPSTHCDALGGRDDSQLVDENLPDSSEVEPGSTVEKRWVLRNVGTTTWTNEVDAILLGEGAWNAVETLNLVDVVEPQQTTTLTLRLNAPEAFGVPVYLRYQLRRQGIPFGSPFWVDISTRSNQSDAGTPGDGGTPDATADAGIEPPAQPRASGCGCTHGVTPSALIWAALFVLRRRFTLRR